MVKTQKGITLIEVLVTLVILSVSLLGLAALQATSLKTIYASESKVLAGVLARSYAEAASANQDLMNSSFTATTSNCQSGMSRVDIKNSWLNDIACSLGPDVFVSVEPSGSGLSISISVSEEYIEEESDNDNSRYTYQYFLAK